MRSISLLTAALLWITLLPATATERVVESDGDNVREYSSQAGNGMTTTTDGSIPNAIGSITTNDTFCYQPDRSRDECFVNWRLHSVSAGTDSMRSLRIKLDNRLVLNMQGFFQTSLFYQAAMVNPAGFKMPCGAPSQADPLIGASYSFQITGVDSNGLTANNFGTVQCPAFSP